MGEREREGEKENVSKRERREKERERERREKERERERERTFCTQYSNYLAIYNIDKPYALLLFKFSNGCFRNKLKMYDSNRVI